MASLSCRISWRDPGIATWPPIFRFNGEILDRARRNDLIGTGCKHQHRHRHVLRIVGPLQHRAAAQSRPQPADGRRPERQFRRLLQHGFVARPAHKIRRQNVVFELLHFFRLVAAAFDVGCRHSPSCSRFRHTRAPGRARLRSSRFMNCNHRRHQHHTREHAVFILRAAQQTLAAERMAERDDTAAGMSASRFRS